MVEKRGRKNKGKERERERKRERREREINTWELREVKGRVPD